MDPFIEIIFMSCAFRAATGQGKGTHIYRPKSQNESNQSYDREKLNFRRAVRDRIKQECQNYQNHKIKESDWLELIQKVCDGISSSYDHILNNKRLRIGTTQKMLSLGLKFYWKSGENLKRPFWPPLDAQVLKAAKNTLEKRDQNISWKKIDDVDQYTRIMRAIDLFAKNEGYENACEWEYDLWKPDDDLFPKKTVHSNTQLSKPKRGKYLRSVAMRLVKEAKVIDAKEKLLLDLCTKIASCHEKAFENGIDLPGKIPTVHRGVPRVHCGNRNGLDWLYEVALSKINAKVFIPEKDCARVRDLLQQVDTSELDIRWNKTGAIRMSTNRGANSDKNDWDNLAHDAVDTMHQLFERLKRLI